MQENKTNIQNKQKNPYHSNIIQAYIPIQLLSIVYDKASDFC